MVMLTVPDKRSQNDHRPLSERKSHERTNDAAAAADLHAAHPCRAAPRRAADRVAPRRGRHPPHHLPRAGRALAPHGQRARGAGRQVRRPRRHAGLERLPPHGAVLRGVGLGRGAAHAQPAPAPRPGGLDRRPRRRPGAVLRPDLPAADRGHRLAREDDQGVRRDDRPRAHAGIEQGARPAVLRGADRRRQRRLHVAELRREHRRRRCATRRAPPATPRARCTATARRCCTPTPRRCPTR